MELVWNSSVELLRSVAGRWGKRCMCCSLFDRPKDVQGCSAAPEEFLQPLVLLCSCFSVPNVCVCVCVCVCDNLLTPAPIFLHTRRHLPRQVAPRMVHAPGAPLGPPARFIRRCGLRSPLVPLGIL